MRVETEHFLNASTEYTFDKYFQLGVAMMELYSGMDVIASINSSL